MIDNGRNYERVEESTERIKEAIPWREKETIEELFWIEIIVDEFYFSILFYFEWKNSREESKKLSLLLRNCWRENCCISLLCFASWIVANSWKTQATDREVENEVAKSSISWKRCSAVRKYLSLRTRRQKERIFDPRARTAAASPHSCSSPNLQTSHKVRLLARSLARFGPVSLVAFHACMHAQRCVLFLLFFLYSHNLDDP